MALFFPDPGDTVTIAKAQSICFQCYVRQDCLSFALTHKTENGVWGGKFFERTRSRRKTKCPRCASTDLMPWEKTIECVACKFSWPR